MDGGSLDDGGFTLDLGQVTKVGAFLIQNKGSKGAKVIDESADQEIQRP